MEKEVDIIVRDEGYYLTFVFNTYKSLKRLSETPHIKYLDKQTYSICAHPDYHQELIEWMTAEGLTHKVI